jgi:hypothetical protein
MAGPGGMSMPGFIGQSAALTYVQRWSPRAFDGIVGAGEPLVIAALAALRRLGTGLMLVAMLAVVVGTGLASASGLRPSVETLEDAGPEHSHMHGDGTIHSHLVVMHHDDDGGVSGDPLADPGQHEHQKPTCCSLAQPVALLGGVDTTVILASGSATLALPPLFQPFGIDPNGLRRPPRPLSAA